MSWKFTFFFVVNMASILSTLGRWEFKWHSRNLPPIKYHPKRIQGLEWVSDLLLSLQWTMCTWPIWRKIGGCCTSSICSLPFQLLVFKHLEQEIVLRELLAVVLCRPVFADQHFNGASSRCQTFLPSKPSLDLSSPASLDLQLTQQWNKKHPNWRGKNKMHPK